MTLLSLLILTSFAVAQDTEVKYELSRSESMIKWMTKDADSEYSGSLKLKSGSIIMKGEEVTYAVIFIDTKSIECSKCGGEIKGQELIEFIKSPKFLNADNMDYAVFKLYEAKPLEKSKEGSHMLKGNLTIIAHSNEVSFPVFIKVKKGKLIVEGYISLNRDLWTLKNPVEMDGYAYSMESKIVLSFTLVGE